MHDYLKEKIVDISNKLSKNFVNKMTPESYDKKVIEI